MTLPSVCSPSQGNQVRLALGHQMDMRQAACLLIMHIGCLSCRIRFVIYFHLCVFHLSSWLHTLLLWFFPNLCWSREQYSMYLHICNTSLWLGLSLAITTDDLWPLPVQLVVWFQQPGGSWGPGKIPWHVDLCQQAQCWWIQQTSGGTPGPKQIVSKVSQCHVVPFIVDNYVFGSLGVKSKMKQLYKLSGYLFGTTRLC